MMARSSVVVGTSGSGKTTLLRMINRLIEAGQRAACWIDGHDTRETLVHVLRRPDRLRHPGGMGCFPPSYGGAEHRHGAEPGSAGASRRSRRRVDELMNLFRARSGDLSRPPCRGALSGGQQQRGRRGASAGGGAESAADGPSRSARSIRSSEPRRRPTSKGIQRRLGTTIVLVTHDHERGDLRWATRIAVMESGQTAAICAAGRGWW